jgi:DNA-binding NarL/FixJ family response regulator
MSLMHVEPMERLTSQERVVLALVAEGHSNLGIADRLSVNVRTVETHTSRIFTKLGLAECGSYHRRVLAALAHLNGSS